MRHKSCLKYCLLKSHLNGHFEYIALYYFTRSTQCALSKIKKMISQFCNNTWWAKLREQSFNNITHFLARNKVKELIYRQFSAAKIFQKDLKIEDIFDFNSIFHCSAFLLIQRTAPIFYSYKISYWVKLI